MLPAVDDPDDTHVSVVIRNGRIAVADSGQDSGRQSSGVGGAHTQATLASEDWSEAQRCYAELVDGRGRARPPLQRGRSVPIPSPTHGNAAIDDTADHSCARGRRISAPDSPTRTTKARSTQNTIHGTKSSYGPSSSDSAVGMTAHAPTHTAGRRHQSSSGSDGDDDFVFYPPEGTTAAGRSVRSGAGEGNPTAADCNAYTAVDAPAAISSDDEHSSPGESEFVSANTSFDCATPKEGGSSPVRPSGARADHTVTRGGVGMLLLQQHLEDREAEHAATKAQLAAALAVQRTQEALIQRLTDENAALRASNARWETWSLSVSVADITDADIAGESSTSAGATRALSATTSDEGTTALSDDGVATVTSPGRPQARQISLHNSVQSSMV